MARRILRLTMSGTRLGQISHPKELDLASTDPDFPATGELTQEWCIDAGVSTTVFSMDICTYCGSIYDVETEAGDTIVQTTELDCAWNAD